MDKNMETSSIDVEIIKEISDVFEICNEYRNIFCFTVTFKNYEIMNVFKKYSRDNRKEIEQEITQKHNNLLKRFKEYKKH